MKLKHILILVCLFVISTGDTLHAVPEIFESDPVQGQREFYQKDVVQTVHLKISPADRRRMLEALPECVYVPASFQWRDIKLEKVTVRFKGNSSSDPRQMHKRS